MTRFADQKHVDAFHDIGEYPRIHERITAAVRDHGGGRRALDLGACTGLLAHRIAQWCPEVHALEPNAEYRSRGVTHPRVTWHEHGVTFDTLAWIGQLIAERGIRLVVARRVFPEIGPAVTAAFADVAAVAGIERIILEGRIPSRRSTDPLPDADAEVQALSATYTPIHADAHVRVLHARNAPEDHS